MSRSRRRSRPKKRPRADFSRGFSAEKNIKTQKRVNIYEIREKTSSRAREIISQIIFCLLLALILFSAVFLAFRGKQSRPTFVFDRTFFWVETESVEHTIDGRSYVVVKRYKGEKIGGRRYHCFLNVPTKARPYTEV